MDQAAKYGQLHIVQWLHAHCAAGCTTQAMDNAAEQGHLRVLQWFHANRSEGCTIEAVHGAVLHKHVDVVRWLHANYSEEEHYGEEVLSSPERETSRRKRRLEKKTRRDENP